MSMVDVATNRTEIAGIPVYWTDLPGPMRASLSFRVGYADETLPTAGISHLCEHLALSSLKEQHFSYNGFVDGVRTVFHAAGREEEVVWFLNLVCHALTYPQLDRLPKELNVLETEGQGRAAGWVPFHHAMRFGPSGWGLASYRELGFKQMNAQRVSDWLSRFNRGNAAIWMTKPPPAGLELTLREGARFPTLPPIPLASTPLPCWIDWNDRFVAVSWLAERTTTSPVLLDVVLRRARSKLRFDEAMSYSVNGAYEPMSADLAHVAVAADCKVEDASRLTEELLSAIEAVANTGPTAEEIDNYVNNTLARAWEEPTSVIGDLDFAVHSELLGSEQLTRSEIRDAILGSSQAEFAAGMASSQRSVLVSIPRGTTPPRSFQRIPDFPEQPVAHGVTYKGLGQNLKCKIVLGTDSITWFQPAGPPATIRLSSCAAYLMWDGYGREIVGVDGVTIHIYPGEWKGIKDLNQRLDQAIRSDRRVPMGLDDRPLPPIKQQPKSSTHFIASIAAILTFITLLLFLASVASRDSSGLLSAIVPGVLSALGWRAVMKRRGG